MLTKKENPGARASAHRVDVTVLAGKDDFEINTATALDLQVRRLLACYALSVPAAVVIAELAFSSGRVR